MSNDKIEDKELFELEFYNYKNKTFKNEGYDLEYKKGNSSGNTYNFKSINESYVAFANTFGGTIVIGVTEDKLGFHASGTNINIDDLFNYFKSKDNVSNNLLRNNDIIEVYIENKRLIVINVPIAPSDFKPLYIGRDPKSIKKGYGIFVRHHTADSNASDYEINTLYSEVTYQVKENKIWENLTIDHLNNSSLQKVFGFKNNYHDILRDYGLIRTNYDTCQTGLTSLSVLLFGKSSELQHIYPNYEFDYAEVLNDKEYSYRYSSATNFNTNLVEFHNVIQERCSIIFNKEFKLESNLKRDDITFEEKVFREAYMNALIHCDYNTGNRIKIRVYKDIFHIENSGSFNIPLANISTNRDSNCINKNLAKFFRMNNFVEEFGIGLKTINNYLKMFDLRLNNDIIVTYPNYTGVKFIIPRVNSKLYNCNTHYINNEEQSGPQYIESGPQSNELEIHNEINKLIKVQVYSKHNKKTIDMLSKIYLLISNGMNSKKLIKEELLLGDSQFKRLVNILVKNNLVVREGKSIATTYKIKDMEENER